MFKIFSLSCIATIFTLLSFTTEPINKVQLGEKLFFDPILSRDSTISCASCHNPTLAFADSLAISPGLSGKSGRRNAPSVMNMAARSDFFYDGRAKSLRDQVHFPIEDPMEMDLPMEIAVQRIKNNSYLKKYILKPQMKKIFLMPSLPLKNHLKRQILSLMPG